MRERDQVLRQIWRRPSPFKGSDLPPFPLSSSTPGLNRIDKDDLIFTKGVTSFSHPTIYSNKQWWIKTLLFSGRNGENKHSLKQWCGFTRSTNKLNNHKKKKHSPQEHKYIQNDICKLWKSFLIFFFLFPPPFSLLSKITYLSLKIHNERNIVKLKYQL